MSGFYKELLYENYNFNYTVFSATLDIQPL